MSGIRFPSFKARLFECLATLKYCVINSRQERIDFNFTKPFIKSLMTPSFIFGSPLVMSVEQGVSVQTNPQQICWPLKVLGFQFYIYFKVVVLFFVFFFGIFILNCSKKASNKTRNYTNVQRSLQTTYLVYCLLVEYET